MSGHTAAPWLVETTRNEEACYSDGGPIERIGFDAYAVVDKDGNVLFDSLYRDSRLSEIHEDLNDDDRYSWDERARKDLTLASAAPDLLQACQTFAEWLHREETGHLQPWINQRGTPEGERAWRVWWNENLRLCDLAQTQARAAIAKAIGGAA